MRPYSWVNEWYPDLFNSSLTPQINKYFNDDRLTVRQLPSMIKY